MADKILHVDTSTGAQSLAAAPATGIVSTSAVYSESLIVGDMVYLHDMAGTLTATKATAGATPHKADGYALEVASSGSHLVGLTGVIPGVLTGATTDAEYFLADTAGTVSATSGSVIQQTVGYAVSATDLMFIPGIPVTL